jgi:dTDP-4-dehydrorhamnose reductase
MQRLLITGGTGYLGGELIRQAHAQGWQVAATYFSHPPPMIADDAQLLWISLDVRDMLQVEEALDAFQPDLIIHTVFQQSGPDLWSVTAEGARNVSVAAQALGVRLIHMSSDVIFDGEHEGAYTEQDAPSPVSPYGVAKAAAEQFVTEHAPNAVLVRTSLIYGFTPIDRHTRFVLDIADGRNTAQLFYDEYRCPIFVGDLAAALLELAQGDYRGVINIAGTECMSRHKFGMLLAQHHGRDPAQLPGSLSVDSAVRRPRNCRLDSSLARRILQTPLRGVRAVLESHPATANE